MVYRIFVEKKPGLDNEARALLADARKFLGIRGLEKVRLLNRYDAENISEDLFSLAVREVFSEPQLDDPLFSHNHRGSRLRECPISWHNPSNRARCRLFLQTLHKEP